MGGVGSGPKPASLKTQQGRNRLNGCVPYAWRTIKRTLASSADSDQIPSPSTLALAQWVLEQDIGKPTVKLSVDQRTTLSLDPTAYLEALEKARLISTEWQLERGEDTPTREVSHAPGNPVDITE